jgi:hypothetical protein
MQSISRSKCTARPRSLVFFALLGATALPACPEHEPGLVIVARSDLVPREEVDRIEVELIGVGVLASLPLGRRSTLADGIVVLDEAFVARPSREIRISLHLGDRVVVSRDLVLDHSTDREILVDLPRACVDVACDVEVGETCVRGQCGGADCVDGTEPGCPPPMCDDDAQCAIGVVCAAGRCRDGTCIALGDDSACEVGQFCDPDRGCAPRRVLDAGTDDDSDAGPTARSWSGQARGARSGQRAGTLRADSTSSTIFCARSWGRTGLV